MPAPPDHVPPVALVTDPAKKTSGSVAQTVMSGPALTTGNCPILTGTETYEGRQVGDTNPSKTSAVNVSSVLAVYVFVTETGKPLLSYQL